MTATVNGQTFFLRPSGANFRWHREDGSPTEIVGTTESEALRAFMFGGLHVASIR
jgi:hypothetical protein